MRRRRIQLFVVLVLVVALVGVRLYLPRAVRDYVDGVLERNGAYTGSVGDVHLALWRGGGVIEDLEIRKREGHVPFPLVKVPKAAASLRWGALLRHGKLALAATLDSPEIHLVQSRDPSRQQFGSGGRWKETIDALTPIKVDRARIRNGTVHYHDLDSDPKLDVYLADLSVTADNLRALEHVGRALPAHAEISATPMTSGVVEVRADLDPLARVPHFQADTKLADVSIVPWNPLLRAYAGLEATSGRIALASRLETQGGRVSGYIEPSVEDLHVEKKEESHGVLAHLWATTVEATKNVLENKHTKDVATRVPIAGTIERPEVDYWIAFFGVLRNAFVDAYSPRFASAPADTR